MAQYLTIDIWMDGKTGLRIAYSNQKYYILVISKSWKIHDKIAKFAVKNFEHLRCIVKFEVEKFELINNLKRHWSSPVLRFAQNRIKFI